MTERKKIRIKEGGKKQTKMKEAKSINVKKTTERKNRGEDKRLLKKEEMKICI